MKLSDNIEVFRFPEEDLVLVTHNGFLYYVYDQKRKHWHKSRLAGNLLLTVKNYPDLSEQELAGYMDGKIPEKLTDFMRLCHPSQLNIRDMLDLLEEDSPVYMKEWENYRFVHQLLLDSGVPYKSYLAVKDIFKETDPAETDAITKQIKDLYFRTTGREIFRKEIEIIDGHDSSSYFWIMPVRIIDPRNTADTDCVAEMRAIEISIEELDVEEYLSPFLFRHFDKDLDANKNRIDTSWTDEEGNDHCEYYEDFEWWLTYNFYTFEAIRNMLKDIRETIGALTQGTETEYTKELLKRGDHATPEQFLAQRDLLIDFYERFLYRMEYMLKVGEENGYDLISFMGP